MTVTDIGTTQVGPDFNIDELTTGTIDGNGVYDVIMQAIKAHLRGEYEAERIRGTDYSNAYVQASIAALQQATGFATAKSKLAKELELLDAQILQASKEGKLADEQLNLLKAQTLEINKNISLKEFDLTKRQPAELEQLSKQTELAAKQINDIQVGIDTKQYQLEKIFPVELEQKKLQSVQIEAQTTQIDAQTEQTLKQTADIVVGTQVKEYQLKKVLPVELGNLTKQGEQLTAQIAQTVKQTEDIEVSTSMKTFQLEKVLPVEVDNLTLQGLQTTAQTSMLSKQSEDVVAGTAIKKFQLEQVLPVEKSNLLATGEGLAAQSLLTKQQTSNLKAEELSIQTKMPIETQILEANLGRTTTETVNLVKQSAILEAQTVREVATTNSIEAQTRQTDYITTNKLPSELLTETLQRSVMDAQVAQTAAMTANVIAEKPGITAKTSILNKELMLKEKEIGLRDYELTVKFPIETQLLTKELDIKESQIEQSDKELLVKQIQIDLMREDLPLKLSQVKLSESELALKATQIELSKQDLVLKKDTMELNRYATEMKTPAETALLDVQTKLYAEKLITEKAQTDPSVVKANSSIDLNNKVLKEQAATFIRNSDQSAAKLMIDTWTIRHTSDPDGNPETAPGLRLTDADIGKAVAKIL